eukprot:CAMPEP_0114226090 /NCGR_PEP_ID=MMETSP0058-20121206/1046_1 /TAXON_ID=36894 /ORGANISM="Pyramimonas parkeae, CCMP726" /LENGTH=250 /DNA_ID=CAMNT_0001336791 /DNA_START=830 /DNA_END=1582 /DNA_ORIENTATION=+
MLPRRASKAVGANASKVAPHRSRHEPGGVVASSMAHSQANSSDNAPGRYPVAPDPAGWMRAMNKCTKYVVSAAVGVAVLRRFDLFAAWAVVGAVLNAAANKVLKRVINASRPQTGMHSKSDPGMPSSHAQSLAFLATLPCFDWVTGPWPAPLAAVTMQMVATGLTSLRVACGYHTVPQVVVGYGVGLTISVLWSYAGVHYVPQVAASTPATYILVGIAVALSVVFIQMVVKPLRLYRKLGAMMATDAPPE